MIKLTMKHSYWLLCIAVVGIVFIKCKDKEFKRSERQVKMTKGIVKAPDGRLIEGELRITLYDTLDYLDVSETKKEKKWGRQKQTEFYQPDSVRDANGKVILDSAGRGKLKENPWIVIPNEWVITQYPLALDSLAQKNNIQYKLK